MQRMPLATINAGNSALVQLVEGACLNGMEKALLQDANDLLQKIARYPLVYKVELF